MSCTKGSQSLSSNIYFRTYNVLFGSSTAAYPNPITTTFCVGGASTSSGADYYVITAQCTSSTSGTLNTIVLRDLNSNHVLDIRFHTAGLSVQTGWILYAYVRLRWA